MGMTQSNLSDPKFGYDLVVAVTEASINATMKQFLDGVKAPEVVRCFVYDDQSNIVPIDYALLKKQAKGSDPFAVPENADPNTNQDLINLKAAFYAGGFKARIGLPDGPLANIPPIVTLSSGTNAPVLFNLLCKEFTLASMEYTPRGSTWLKKSQPAGAPWYFSANVELKPDPINPKSPPSYIPKSVRDRINELSRTVGADAFGVQQLLLLLDKAFVKAVPEIVGVPKGSKIWGQISSMFLDVYLKQLRANGDPVLGYSIHTSKPDRSTLRLGALSYECCALLEAAKPPTAEQQRATTLVYLGTTGTTPPTPVPFSWNWVDLGEVSALHGVQSVRRDVFLDFFKPLLNRNVGPLSQEPFVEVKHVGGENFTVEYRCRNAPNPKHFENVPFGPPDPKDGFTKVFNLGYAHKSHGQANTGAVWIYADFNYQVDGSVAFKDNVIRLVIRAQCWMQFTHWETAFKSYVDLEGANYYDRTLTVLWDLGASQTGELKVNRNPTFSDESKPWDFKNVGVLGFFGYMAEVKNGFTTLQGNLSKQLNQQFASYEGEITRMINDSKAWVFPGADTFVFKNVRFAPSLDLVAQLTYARPS